MFKGSFDFQLEGRPFTGARIETMWNLKLAVRLEVAPSRGHELKHRHFAHQIYSIERRPFMGARIETFTSHPSSSSFTSPLHGGAD